MTTILVPTELATARERLSGLGRLMTARKWERAAIVYAFTEVGERGAGRWHKPDPPKMHIREFAAQGFAGLTTNKAVSRYRDAWVSAISNGWAGPVEPGMSVILPDQEFPAWPYGVDYEGEGSVTVTEEDESVTRMDDYRRTRGANRPVAARVLSHLEDAAKALSQLAEISRDDLDDDLRDQLVLRLAELRRQTDDALKALRNLVSV